MNVKAIKIIPNVGNSGLEFIYGLQKELIEPYIKIEGLPPYPLDVNTKENQVLLKDFISRIIEELGEGFEVFTKLADIAILPKSKDDNAEQLLWDFNEELSDAMHFFIETLIYINIEASDIKAYTHKLLDTYNLNTNDEDNTLENIIKIAAHFNNIRGRMHHRNQRGNRILLENDNPFIMAGNKVCDYQLENMKVMLWEVTYWLQMVRNCLKNKPWTAGGKPTDEPLLQARMMEAFMHFILYLDFMGMTPEAIFHVYFRKNQVNFDRIKNNY